MTKKLVLMILIFLSWHAYAQQEGSIIQQRTDSLKSKVEAKRDTLKSKFQQQTERLDTLKEKLQSKTSKLDTLKQNVLSKSDDLKSGITSKIDSLDQATLGKIEQEVTSLNQKLDSLNNLQLPSGKYKQKADSLYKGFQEKVLGRYKLKTDSLSSRVKERITRLDKTISEKTSLMDSLFTANGLDLNFNLKDKFNGVLPQQNLPPANTSGINNLDFPMPNAPMPNTSIPNANIPNPNTQISNTQFPIPNASMPNTSMPNASDIPGMKDIQSIQEKISDVTSVVKDAEGYADELKKVQEMDVKNMEKIPEAAEKQLLKIDEVGAAQSELSKAEALKKEMAGFGEQAKSPEEMKEEVMHRTKQPFVDYLEGHEDKVKSGMNKMFDLQKKYRTIADTRFLPKRWANKMKEKPFRERVVPGVFFQINQQLQPWTGVDISPFIGYRLSGRFRTFVGGTYRIYLNVRDLKINTQDRAYAVRWFTHVKAINGIYVHLEAERKIEDFINQPLQPKLGEVKFNVWQNHYYAGLMRMQRINKNVNGTFYALYNFDNAGKTFNFNQIALRFGLEYKLKKKKKPVSAVEVKK